MLLWLVGVFVLVSWPGGQAGDAQAQPSPAEVFELHLGGRVYEVSLDRPFTLVTPAGERVELVLRRREVLRYETPELAFDYPAALRLHREIESGITTLTLEGVASPFVLIQLYPGSPAAADILANLVAAFLDEYAGRQAQFLSGNNTPVSRLMGGHSRDGRQLRFRLAGQEMVTEIYAFAKPNAVVAVVLQHDTAEASLAERYFAIVTRRLQ
ncbi:MAG: hypothetical protein KatS3mg131_0935 [Candidatus Tectimicrobiota bacterium]|nr:MAG: hypothetical protein KatS3mg131_0935 [Candidatus Tectomicrobia bacterium]